MKTKILKKEKGITLVALIITIIVLLILAIVSIRLVMNGGIIDRAERGTQAYSEAEIQEQIKLAYAEWQTAQFTSDAGDAATFMQGRLRTSLKDNELTVTGENGVFTITLTGGKEYTFSAATGKSEKVKTVADYPTATPGKVNNNENTKYTSNGKTAVIPAGYTVDATQNSIDNGLVISKDGNEWVWIPVANVTDLYTENTTNSEWKLYGTDGDSKVVSSYASKSEILSGVGRTIPGVASSTNNFREPDTLVGYDSNSYDKVEANYTADGFNSFNNMATKLRDDYKNMIDSVRKNGGFYIGRYELGGTTSAPQEKAGTVMNNTNWYNLYKACKTFGDESITYSRMIWGCQWDQVCKFIETAKDANGNTISLSDSRKYGNYDNSEAPANTNNGNSNFNNTTGRNDAWKTNNIYDLAGNCYEWTQEASYADSRAGRGGNYLCNGDDSPVTYRGSLDPTFTSGSLSSRPVLYLK